MLYTIQTVQPPTLVWFGGRWFFCVCECSVRTQTSEQNGHTSLFENKKKERENRRMCAFCVYGIMCIGSTSVITPRRDTMRRSKRKHIHAADAEREYEHAAEYNTPDGTQLCALCEVYLGRWRGVTAAGQTHTSGTRTRTRNRIHYVRDMTTRSPQSIDRVDWINTEAYIVIN